MKKNIILIGAIFILSGCTAQSLYLESNDINMNRLVENTVGQIKSDEIPLDTIIELSNRNLWDQAIIEGKSLRDNGSSMLRYAVKKGTKDFAYYIIDHGANIQYVDAQGKNELMYMNKFLYGPNYYLFVKKLIENGCDINAVNGDGYNVLEDAVIRTETVANANNSEEKNKIKTLIENGADLRVELLSILEKQHYIYYSALKELSDQLRTMDFEINNCIDAIILGNQDRFSEFLQSELFSDEEKNQIIFYVAAIGTVNQLIQVIETFNLTLDCIDPAGNNLLMAAAAGGNEEVYFYLVNRVSLNVINDRSESLITLALSGENEVILDDLIENERFDWNYDTEGDEFSCFSQLVNTLSYCNNEKYLEFYLSDVELKDYAKIRAPQILIENKNMAFLKMLQKETTLTTLSKDKLACEDILNKCRNPEQVHAILQFISPDIRCGMGNALSRILSRESPGVIDRPEEIIKEFVSAGVELNKNISGKSVVLSATHAGDTASVKELIAHGANVNMASPNDGRTPLMVAAMGDEIILKILLENGAEINANDHKGNNALVYAIGWSAENCVRILLEHGADKNICLDNGKSLYEYAVEKGNQEIIQLLK